jgi:predicted phage-related endonuclease
MPRIDRTAVKRDRRHFLGGSDALIIRGKDEKALLRLWREKAVRKFRLNCRAS